MAAQRDYQAEYNDLLKQWKLVWDQHNTLALKTMGAMAAVARGGGTNPSGQDLADRERLWNECQALQEKMDAIIMEAFS